MGSLGLLIALDSLMIIAILVLGIAAAFGAYYCTKSSSFTSNEKVKSAHKILTWIAVVGIVLFALILTITIVVAVKGKHKAHFETNNKNISLATKNLNKHNKTSWLVISLLILNIIVFLSLGIAGVFAAIDLQSVVVDDDISAAYKACIAIAISGLVGGVVAIAAIVSSFVHKNKNEKNFDKAFEKSPSTKISERPVERPVERPSKRIEMTEMPPEKKSLKNNFEDEENFEVLSNVPQQSLYDNFSQTAKQAAKDAADQYLTTENLKSGATYLINKFSGSS